MSAELILAAYGFEVRGREFPNLLKLACNILITLEYFNFTNPISNRLILWMRL